MRRGSTDGEMGDGPVAEKMARLRVAVSADMGRTACSRLQPEGALSVPHSSHRLQPVVALTPRVTYEEVGIARTLSVRPDVGFWKPDAAEGTVAGAGDRIVQATAESTISLELPLKLYTVEIHETGTLKLVTAIEILSPVNKRPGHEAFEGYRRKRRHLLRSDAHLLEIDLLRGGERPPLDRPVPPAPIRKLHPGFGRLRARHAASGLLGVLLH